MIGVRDNQDKGENKELPFKVQVSLNGTDYYDLSPAELAMILGEQQFIFRMKYVIDTLNIIGQKTKIEHLAIKYSRNVV